MKLLKWALLLFTIVMSNSVIAQSKLYENTVDFELKNIVSIVNNKQTVGYGVFYKMDKLKDGNLYRLSVLDENLKEVGSNEFEGPSSLQLTKALYESEQIYLSFRDKKKTNGYDRFVKVFNLKGKDQGLIPYDPEKVKSGLFGGMIANILTDMYEGNVTVEGKGIVALY